jgi:hypothetical protein
MSTTLLHVSSAVHAQVMCFELTHFSFRTALGETSAPRSLVLSYPPLGACCGPVRMRVVRPPLSLRCLLHCFCTYVMLHRDFAGSSVIVLASDVVFAM